ncbi:hypothetical protein NMY22_g19857 [Coprinellus aureogranulatus]|nr:hypothetical protein NMY22_g19857 [Coprinellus aureogranulatus]
MKGYPPSPLRIGQASPSPPNPSAGEDSEQKKKPFYRPRPLWLVPFAIIAALVRGMTLAPRVEVYTQLACYSLHPSPPSIPPINIPDHEPPTKRRRTESVAKVEWTPDSAISLYAGLDPLGPHLFPAPQLQRVPRALPPPTSRMGAMRSESLSTGLTAGIVGLDWARTG